MIEQREQLKSLMPGELERQGPELPLPPVTQVFADVVARDEEEEREEFNKLSGDLTEVLRARVNTGATLVAGSQRH